MIHAFKAGGGYKDSDGREYSVKAINYRSDLPDGWSLTLEEALKDSKTESKETGSDYEKELREEIKQLGGTAGGRSSISTLENQLLELQEKGENDGE